MSKKFGPRKLTIADAKHLLRSAGIVLTYNPTYREFRVRHVGEKDTNAGYFTDDLVDAYQTGLVMSRQGKGYGASAR